MYRVGLAFNGPPYAIAEIVDASRMAEDHGFDSVWHAEDPFGPDAMTALACIAVATRRVRLGTAVVSPYTRACVTLASTFAALDQLSNARMIIGLGVGQAWLPLAGLADHDLRKVHDMRASIDLLRAAIRGDDLVIDDSLPTISGRPVSLRRGFNWQPWGGVQLERSRIPIHVGTRGPRMLQLAGELADGLILEYAIPMRSVGAAVEALEQAALSSGRDLSSFETGGIVLFSPSRDGVPDPSLRLFVAARCAAITESDVRDWGFDQELVTRIASLWLAGEEQAAAALVPETMLRDLVIAGSATECIDRLHEYRTVGRATPLLMPQACDLRMALEVGAAYARSD